MKTNTFKFLLILLIGISAVLVSSCVKNIDISQAENAEYTTPLLMPLVYFTLVSSDFLDTSGNENLYRIDETDMVIESSIMSSIKPTVVFETKTTNTFNRSVFCEVYFVDTYGTDLVNKAILIPANSTNYIQNIPLTNDEIVLFKQTARIRTEILMNPSTTPLQPTDSYLFNFQSAVRLHVGYPN